MRTWHWKKNGGNDVVETSDLRSDEKTFKEFLEFHPPGGSASISDLWRKEIEAYGPRIFLNTPDLFLHCTHQDCNGHRYFRCNSGQEILGNGGNSFFVSYQCSNCKMTKKRYALFAAVDTEARNSVERELWRSTVKSRLLVHQLQLGCFAYSVMKKTFS